MKLFGLKEKSIEKVLQIWNGKNQRFATNVIFIWVAYLTNKRIETFLLNVIAFFLSFSLSWILLRIDVIPFSLLCLFCCINWERLVRHFQLLQICFLIISSDLFCYQLMFSLDVSMYIVCISNYFKYLILKQ